MTEKHEWFTQEARRALIMAQEEAMRLQHNYIGTEHILLGLVRDETCTAAKLLASMRANLSKTRTTVEFVVGRGESMIMGEIGMSPRAKKVIGLALSEARNFQHAYIGTEHMLLGLLREGEGVGAGVLTSMGISLEQARATVHQQMTREGSKDATEVARRVDSSGFIMNFLMNLTTEELAVVPTIYEQVRVKRSQATM